jgi:hypothetical protein
LIASSAAAAEQAWHGAVAPDQVIVGTRPISQIRLRIRYDRLRLKILRQHAIQNSHDFAIWSEAPPGDEHAVSAALNLNRTPGPGHAHRLASASLADHRRDLGILGKRASAGQTAHSRRPKPRTRTGKSAARKFRTAASLLEILHNSSARSGPQWTIANWPGHWIVEHELLRPSDCRRQQKQETEQQHFLEHDVTYPLEDPQCHYSSARWGRIVRRSAPGWFVNGQLVRQPFSKRRDKLT